MSTFGKISGVIVQDLVKHLDNRGWLSELYRSDEIEETYLPVMSYLSMTNPGVARGPHEHMSQADLFAFIGPSDFKIYLWDNRISSSTYRMRQIIFAGENSPRSVIIPPGVVHAYRNVGITPGMVVNLPNRLFAGRGRKDPVDEVRHEADLNSPYQLD